MLDAAAGERAAFRFLHVSTDEVYGSLGPDDPPFSETTPYAPNIALLGLEGRCRPSGARLSPHLRSADAHDQLLQQLRPVSVSGEAHPADDSSTPLDGKPLPVYGDGRNVRDWLYVDDHCAAIRAVLAGGRPGETYNVGGNAR